jgi:formiminoglutamase
MSWLKIHRGKARLIVSIPHAGTEIPEVFEPALVSLWLARKDADWWLKELYGFAESFDATVISTEVSRTIIDLNRDPSGKSLYPGQATTELCPSTTFDGEALYRGSMSPEGLAHRRLNYFDPYHDAITKEISRLKSIHESVVLYDCHSIRSSITRLFPGTLPNFNIGTNDGKSCKPALTERISGICAAAQQFTHVVNGRFKGGYITRHYGDPASGVHAIQMELACRGYMREPTMPDETNWPSVYDEAFAAPLRNILMNIFESICR